MTMHICELSAYNPEDPEDCAACAVSPGPCPYHQGVIDGLNEARDSHLIEPMATAISDAAGYYGEPSDFHRAQARAALKALRKAEDH